MLFGRAAEQARIRDLLDAGRRGRSGALVLRGEAGIGKTALLDYGRSCAEGMAIADLVGTESESKLAFAGLSALVRPLSRHLTSLMPRQRQALEAALALGPPVESDRLAVAAATLGLLAAAAEDRPLVVLIDDAHWLDDPSREAILFAARRLRDDNVCLLLASRDDEPGSLVGERIPQLVLGPLTAPDAIDLLTRDADVVPVVAERICAATAGNPLALLAASELLTHAQRRGLAPLGDPLRTGSAEAAFGRIAAGLPGRARRALLVACTDGSGRCGPVLAAMHRLGLDADALAPAERAQLVEIAGDRLSLRHPIVRSAVYHAADRRERRAVHAALAAAYAEDAEADRRAWHLGAAAAGPDEAVAAALEAAAERATRRHGHAAAVDALERAADLSPLGSSAARRLVAAARAAAFAGQPDRVVALTDRASGRTTDPLVEADLVLLRARATGDHDLAGACADLERAAQIVATHDATREWSLLLEAAMAAERFDIRRAVAFAARAVIAASRAGLDPVLTELLHARLLHVAGQPVPEPAMVLPPRLDDLEQARVALWLTGSNATPDRAQLALVDAIVALTREKAALGLLPEALLNRASDEFYLGDWVAAVADNHEANSLARAVGRLSIACEACGNLARIHAFQGDEEQCRTHLSEYLRLSRSLGMAEYEDFAGVYLGELALTRGEPEEAIRHLAPTGMARTISRARAGLIEAYVRVGAVEEARRSLADLAEMVERGGSPAGRVFRARLDGLLAEDVERASAAFEEALGAAETLKWPLETARTELLYGERLRRDGRRRAARGHLVRAAELFDRLGARPWAERALAELSATGRHLQRTAHPEAGLTPQELQLAHIVARGATNREAAERLFVSPKTVEAHLGAIYRKLGVRSRTELAARLASATPTPTPERTS